MIGMTLQECGKTEQALVCVKAAYDISSYACSLREKLEDVSRLAGYDAHVGLNAEAIECFDMYFTVRMNERRALGSPLLDERHEAHYYRTYALCLIAVDDREFRWQDKWKNHTVGVTCVQLKRRVMAWDATAGKNNMTGADHYKAGANPEQKRDGKLFTEKPVADFWAMHYDKLENMKTICVYRPCKDFCSDIYYHYSNGCGQDADPWVAKKISEEVELLKMSALTTQLVNGSGVMLKDYVIVPQGKCDLCKECDPGQYNPDCNKWEVGVEPKGLCKTCLSECGAGQFLWHASGLRGCDPGVATGNDTKGTVQVLTDYECKPCPTWIRRNGANGGMYAVLGCGNKATFRYHKADIEKNSIDVDFTVKEVKDKILADRANDDRPDVDWKFKPFVYAIDYSAFVTQKVIKGVHVSVTTVQRDTLAAETAAYLTTEHPEYSILAARIAVSNLHKQTRATPKRRPPPTAQNAQPPRTSTTHPPATRRSRRKRKRRRRRRRTIRFHQFRQNQRVCWCAWERDGYWYEV